MKRHSDIPLASAKRAKCEIPYVEPKNRYRDRTICVSLRAHIAHTKLEDVTKGDAEYKVKKAAVEKMVSVAVDEWNRFSFHANDAMHAFIHATLETGYSGPMPDLTSMEDWLEFYRELQNLARGKAEPRVVVRRGLGKAEVDLDRLAKIEKKEAARAWAPNAFWTLSRLYPDASRFLPIAPFHDNFYQNMAQAEAVAYTVHASYEKVNAHLCIYLRGVYGLNKKVARWVAYQVMKVGAPFHVPEYVADGLPNPAFVIALESQRYAPCRACPM